MARISQSIYSPLPQSISDSDSEKEIYMDSVSLTYGKQSTPNSKIIIDREKGSEFKKLQDDLPKAQKLSTKLPFVQRCAFILSILMCFLPLVILLWILPCSESESCKQAFKWENNLMNIEIKGSINLVKGLYGDTFNLAVLYEGSKNLHEELNNGVISFLGTTGAVAWNFRQEIIPRELDCSLIDVNANGVKDCLLLDERGLKVLGTISGEIIWHAHSQEEGKTICDLGFPVKIADVNKDGVDELFMLYKQESFLIVCGRTGKALKIVLAPCHDIGGLKYLNGKIVFTCYNSTENYMIFVKDLEKKFESDSIHSEVIRTNLSLQHGGVEVLKESRRRILSEVQGYYPNCSVKITLLDNILSEKVFTWNFNNAYMSEPKNFSLKLLQINSAFPDGLINGFLFKLWHWPNNVQNFTFTTNGAYSVNNITENVVLIAYNYVNTFSIFNVSVKEITQLCFHYTNGRSICQPDFMAQTHSILIATLDLDEALKLIMYSVSFTLGNNKDSHQSNWNLMSTIAVKNLREELENVLQNL